MTETPAQRAIEAPAAPPTDAGASSRPATEPPTEAAAEPPTDAGAAPRPAAEPPTDAAAPADRSRSVAAPVRVRPVRQAGTRVAGRPVLRRVDRVVRNPDLVESEPEPRPAPEPPPAPPRRLLGRVVDVLRGRSADRPAPSTGSAVPAATESVTLISPPPARGPRNLARAGVAVATAAEPLAESPRPALSLVSAPHEPPAVSRAGVDALAEAVGAEAEVGRDGLATIDFNGPGTPRIPPFSTAPVTVSRDLTDSLPSAASRLGGETVRTVETLADRGLDAARGAVGTVRPDAAAALRAAAKPDPDEMYEQVLQRLRRDLIAEMEQNGHLLRDHP